MVDTQNVQRATGTLPSAASYLLIAFCSVSTLLQVGCGSDPEVCPDGRVGCHTSQHCDCRSIPGRDTDQRAGVIGVGCFSDDSCRGRLTLSVRRRQQSLKRCQLKRCPSRLHPTSKSQHELPMLQRGLRDNSPLSRFRQRGSMMFSRNGRRRSPGRKLGRKFAIFWEKAMTHRGGKVSS